MKVINKFQATYVVVVVVQSVNRKKAPVPLLCLRPLCINILNSRQAAAPQPIANWVRDFCSGSAL